MQTKNGMCRFCGQNRIVEVPNNFTQEEIDEEVTLVCPCDGERLCFWFCTIYQKHLKYQIKS